MLARTKRLQDSTVWGLGIIIILCAYQCTMKHPMMCIYLQPSCSYWSLILPAAIGVWVNIGYPALLAIAYQPKFMQIAIYQKGVGDHWVGQ